MQTKHLVHSSLHSKSVKIVSSIIMMNVKNSSHQANTQINIPLRIKCEHMKTKHKLSYFTDISDMTEPRDYNHDKKGALGKGLGVVVFCIICTPVIVSKL